MSYGTYNALTDTRSLIYIYIHIYKHPVTPLSTPLYGPLITQVMHEARGHLQGEFAGLLPARVAVRNDVPLPRDAGGVEVLVADEEQSPQTNTLVGLLGPFA